MGTGMEPGLTSARNPMDKPVTGRVTCPRCKGRGVHRWQQCRFCDGEGMATYPAKCMARSKQSKEQCKRWVAFPKWVCRMHGGAPGSGPPGNKHAQKSGLYSSTLPDDAKGTYEWLLDTWDAREHAGGDADELLLADNTLFTTAKIMHLLSQGPDAFIKHWDAVERLLGSVRSQLEARGRLQYLRREDRVRPPEVVNVVIPQFIPYGTPPEAIDVTPEPKQLPEPAKSLRVPAMPAMPEPELEPAPVLQIVRDPNDNNEDES